MRNRQYRIPETIKDKGLRDGVNIALHYLVLGYRPACVCAEGKVSTQRVVLSEVGERCLAQLTDNGEWEGERDVIIAALSWLKEQPAHVRAVRVE